MKTNHIIFMTAAVAALAIFTSCKKDNPEAPHNPTEETLSPKSFEVSLTEVRQSKTFTWDVSASGATDNHEETIKDLYVTKYNTVTLNATAEVNVKAEKPAIVSVTRISNKAYALEYKGDGQTVITVWNGEGTSRYERTFKVYGQECVDITGIKFLWYEYDRENRSCHDKVISINHYKDKSIVLGNKESYYSGPGGSIADKEDESDFYFDSDYNDWDNIFEWGPDDYGIIVCKGGKPYGHEMVFLGFEPENTSFRQVLHFQSEYINGFQRFYSYMVQAGEIENGTFLWLNERNLNCDFSELIGTKAFLAGSGGYVANPFYMAVIAVQADITRYYYLYHRKDAYAKPTDEDRHGHATLTRE